MPSTRLDGLLGHLSSCSGLYARETFSNLYGCITRMVRDQRLRGFALTRTLGEDAFESMTCALEHLPDVPLFRLDEALPGIADNTGFLMVLTDRLTAILYWSPHTYDAFRMYEGGWTFHPGDSRTVVSHLVEHLADHPEAVRFQELLDATPMDRRYDHKFNVLITSLVNGLENRNRELRVALEQVNALNRKMVESERLAAIGQLCSVIAHEIRNPLGLVDLYAKIIETQLQQWADVPPEAQAEKTESLYKNLSLIRQSVGSLETILSELTQYSRPLQLNLEPLSIGALVQDVCDFYRPSFDEQGVALVVNLGEAVTLCIDAGKIRQALMNLLKNALEVSSQGHTVRVTVASRQGEGSLYVKVTDQGPGVDPALVAKLFTPYFSTKGNGTGLGLAHSRKILQAHGGTVELLGSTPQQATTFALVLPKGGESPS